MCKSCEVLYINGVKCHETGCPEAWRDKMHECAWCGQDFEPEFDGQKCCSESCYSAYNGYPEPEDDDNQEEVK